MEDLPLTEEVIRVLLIEDNPVDTQLITKMLHDIDRPSIHLKHAKHLTQGMNYLAKHETDLVLLDLRLSDSSGIETLSKVHTHSPDTPLIILTGMDDDEIAFQVVRNGAQDYLLKEGLDPRLLARSIRYAMDRSKQLQELKTMTLTDDLTGLHNRRGFHYLAEQQMKIDKRERRVTPILFIDLDKLKEINDTLGHPCGDQALIDTSNILRKTLRQTDIISRVGGDEFAALTVQGERSTEQIIKDRLIHKVEDFNRTENRPYSLSLSVGVIYSDPDEDVPVDTLLTQADLQMYQIKLAKKNSR